MKSLVLGKRPSRKKVAFFNPKEIFSFGEQGVWYDPSDFTTMFQDSAGTIPVTAVEQPVGLLLDKSQELVLGPELVTNGDFSSNTWWTVGGGAAISGGTLNFTAAIATSGAYRLSFATIGKYYEVTFEVVSISSGGVQITLGNSAGTNRTTAGVYTQRILCTGSTNLTVFSVGASTTASVDNVSIKEVSGNHATQPTSASRPVLSARVNQLTYSEDFSNTAWVKGAGATATVSVLSTLAGTGNHWTFRNGVANGTQTFSVEAKAGTVSWMAMGQGNTGAAFNTFFNLSTGSLGTVASGQTASILNVGDGWYLCTITLNFTTTNASIAVTNADNVAASWNAAGTENINIRKADLRVTNDGVGIPAYQRVNTSTDYDTTGFPYYLRFDGTDDSMVTNTITPGIDKAQVFAGVRKLSDAALGIVAELAVVSGASNPGSFFMTAPRTAGTGDFAFNAGGTTFGSGAISPNSFPSPTTRILTGLGDISGDSVLLRVNGTQEASSSADLGSGNFGNYPLYLGRRGGSTFPLNGRIYSLIVRFGANLSTNEIKQMETWVAKKTGVSL